MKEIWSGLKSRQLSSSGIQSQAVLPQTSKNTPSMLGRPYNQRGPNTTHFLQPNSFGFQIFKTVAVTSIIIGLTLTLVYTPSFANPQSVPPQNQQQYRKHATPLHLNKDRKSDKSTLLLNSFKSNPQFQLIKENDKISKSQSQIINDQVGSSQTSMPWWKTNSELWKEISEQSELDEVLKEADGKLTLVEYFATWCGGCRMAYPKLCDLARDPAINSKIQFIKVNVDAGRRMFKAEGVSDVPRVVMFDAKGDRIAGFSAFPTNTVRENVMIIMQNPERKYTVSGENNLLKPLDDVQHEQTQKDTEEQSEQREAEKAAAKLAFLEQYGDKYGYNGKLERTYHQELGSRLNGHHYLDYTGSSLYSSSYMAAVYDDFMSNVYGNPHSMNPSSELTDDKVQDMRLEVLKWFGADPKEYQVVFTRSCTDALKMVGEMYPWTQNSKFRYLEHNHNSVLGIREYAVKNKASFESMKEEEVESWLANQQIDDQQPAFNLFAFPAEDNFAGVKYPLSWIKKIQDKSSGGCEWKVVLDAAAYVPTQPLNLSETPADFVTVSFYKILGFPTGLGALIIKNENVETLQKCYFGGGSVSVATSNGDFHVLKCNPSERLEDGTLAFLDIVALHHGFDYLRQLGGMQAIQSHVASLSDYMYDQLSNLRHSNGAPMTKIFGKHDHPNRKQVQGGIINFEVLRPDGTVMSYKTVEKEAAKAGFHIRTGCECNPGACYDYLGIQDKEVEQLAGKKEGCADDVEWILVERSMSQAPSLKGPNGGFRDIPDDAIGMDTVSVVDKQKWQQNSQMSRKEVPGKVVVVQLPLGSIRASLGYLSTFDDVYEFVRFIQNNYQDGWQ